MTHPLSTLIDNALRRAEADGAFDNLPGAGKPLPNLHEPADAVLDRMMKSAHAMPPAVVLHRKIVASRRRLSTL